jgi:hypothetical protein
MDHLSEYLAGLGPFDWAAGNCCHFAARWVAFNGQPDPMAGLRCTPTLRAARRLEHELGGIVAAVSHALGREHIPVASARVGDIVHFALPQGGFTLGICNGRASACLDEAGSISWPPTLEGTCAWRLVP